VLRRAGGAPPRPASMADKGSPRGPPPWSVGAAREVGGGGRASVTTGDAVEVGQRERCGVSG
jgi:hypothetical protein